MFFRPDFIHTDENWIIWLLAEEFNETATPEMIIERTHLLPDQVEEILRNLERIKAVKAVHDKGPISVVRLSSYGRSVYEKIRELESMG